MTTKPEKTHCRRCGRTIKPRWILQTWEGNSFIGPTCRKKWIEDGTYCAEDFVDTKAKVKK